MVVSVRREGSTRLEAFSDGVFAISLGFNAVWRYGVSGGRLLHPEADLDGVATISRRYLIGPFAYLLAFGLAFVNVWASLAVHGVLTLLYLLPERT